MNYQSLVNFLLLGTVLVFYSQSTNTLAQTPLQGPEVEAKNIIGTINPTQQSYHFERQTFASSLAELGVNFDASGRYQSPVIQKTDQAATVSVSAAEDGLRSFSGAILYNGGSYSQIICVSNTASKTIGVPVVQGNQLSCPGGSSEIK